MRRMVRRQASVATLLVMSAMALILALGGCVEVYKGPRVVRYTDTSFYIRHIPLLNGAETANEIAVDRCGRQAAVLTDAYQDVPIGIRYASYECI